MLLFLLLLIPPEAFLPWLGDHGLPSESCSSVRQRWRHLRQWVHPVCREAVSTHSCSSSHTFSQLPGKGRISSEFFFLFCFIWFKRREKTGVFIFNFNLISQDNQDGHSHRQGWKLLMDDGDDFHPRPDQAGISSITTWSQSFNKFESAVQDFLIFPLFHNERLQLVSKDKYVERKVGKNMIGRGTP